MGIWNGGPEVVRLLLEYGAAPGNQDIVDAVKKKNPETVLMLVEHGADPAEAFFVALAFSQYDLAERLLEANAGIDGSSHKASLALQDAAYEGSAQGVKMLLDAGFSAEALDQNGETALFNALNNDKGTEAVEVVTLLCKAGADPRRIIEGRGYLKMAFEKNLPATAEVLTAFGANEPGMTAFHRAVLTGRPEELKSLLERKSASAPILNELLAHAVRYGKPQIVELLLQAGANPNLVVEEHYPLLYIALMEDHLPVAEILLRHGANADPRLQFMPHDLLELVLEKKKIRAAYLLVKYGVTLSTEERRRSVLQELLKSMPEELPQFLHSCGIHSETSRQQAVDVAKALEFDDKRGKESFQKLFESFQSTHDPRMAALLRALLPDDSLCGYLHSYLHDNLSTGNRGIVRDCLALVPEPGQFRFGRCWYRADDITDQFLEMLPVVLEHSIGLNNNDVGLLLEVLSAKGRSRQFLEFFDHYREKLDESDYAKLLKKVAESPDSALFAELYRRRPVKKTDDNFVLGVARAGNRLGLELLAAQGVDLGSFTWAVTDPFWGYVPYRECYRGVLASFVGYEYGSGRTVGESLKLVAKPDPRDVDHAYRRALSLNSFHVLGDLYRAGFRADKESLEELGTIPGRRYLEMLEQGIDEPLWTSDMLVEVAKGYGEDDLRYLAAILKRGINVNAKDSQGRLALNVAAANNRETTLFLLENGADINARDSEGTSPVIEAASSKPEHIELLRNADTESFEYAAAWCAYNGMTNGFERLAESGFLPEGKFPTRDGEYNILALAAISGSSAIVSRVLSLLDVPLKERTEALRLAVDRGHFYCTRALLKGVDPRKILIDGVSIRQYIGKSAHSRRLAKLAD
jgi:ankyrin repeat protein